MAVNRVDLKNKKFTDLGVTLSAPVTKTLKELKFLTSTPVQVNIERSRFLISRKQDTNPWSYEKA